MEEKSKVQVVDFYVDLRGWYHVAYSNWTADRLTKEQVIEKLNLALEVSDHGIANNCFVLRPGKDPAAKMALLAYADATDDVALAEDIRRLIDAMEEM